MADILVAAFYKFVDLPDFAELQPGLLEFAKSRGVMGTILLADEGINGTVAGSETGVRALLDHIRSDPRLSDLEHKESRSTENPFHRMKVRLKREIVTLGVEGVSPTRQVGEYVRPDRWNALIADPDTIVIDTRNDYEVAIGSFEGATDPATSSFRDFPEWFRAQSYPKDKKIAMFCTGGIRCEKSTSFLKAEGYESVFHLEGGILKYLETVPENESRWRGECFVFDERVSVGHGLEPGPYDLCHACRHPISEADKASEQYKKGVSCPRCHGTHSADQEKRFSERQKQMELATARGEKHIAADQKARREAKKQARKAHAERSSGRGTK